MGHLVWQEYNVTSSYYKITFLDFCTGNQISGKKALVWFEIYWRFFVSGHHSGVVVPWGDLIGVAELTT